MNSSETLNLLTGAETNGELRTFYREKEDTTLSGRVKEDEKTLASEKSGNDGLDLYVKQLKNLPLLSAKDEKNLCREIKQKEKEIEGFIAHWFEVIEDNLKLGKDLLFVKPCLYNRFSISYCCSGNGSYRLKGTLLQFEKINALEKELERVKSVLSESSKKIPNLDDWRETKEKGDIEISKLVSQIKIDGEMIKKVLHQVEREVTKEKKSTNNWEQSKKNLETILNNIKVDVHWIRKKKNELIKAHLPLVVNVAKGYRNRGVDLLDLIQEGNQGLMRAVETFDYRRGNRFISYAVWWVRQSIIRAIHNQSRTMRIPVYLFDQLSRYFNASETLSQEKGREPTLAELAEEMKVSVDHVMGITHSFRIPQPLEDYSLFQARIKRGSSDFESILGLTIQSDLRRRVNSFLADLSPRESEVLRLRFGINGMQHEHSLQEIGRRFNLSRERIRQIEKSALTKLRRMNRIQELREFLS